MPTLTEQINTSLGDVNISVSIDGEVQKLITIAETLIKLVDDPPDEFGDYLKVLSELDLPDFGADSGISEGFAAIRNLIPSDISDLSGGILTRLDGLESTVQGNVADVIQPAINTINSLVTLFRGDITCGLIEGFMSPKAETPPSGGGGGGGGGGGDPDPDPEPGGTPSTTPADPVLSDENINNAKAFVDLMPSPFTVENLIPWLSNFLGDEKTPYTVIKAIPVFDDLRVPLATLVKWNAMSGADMITDFAATISQVTTVVEQNTTGLVGKTATDLAGAIGPLDTTLIGNSATDIINHFETIRLAVEANDVSGIGVNITAINDALVELNNQHVIWTASVESPLNGLLTKFEQFPEQLEDQIGQLVTLLQPRPNLKTAFGNESPAIPDDSNAELQAIEDFFEEIRKFLDNVLNAIDLTVVFQPIAEPFQAVTSVVEEINQQLVNVTLEIQNRLSEVNDAIDGIDLATLRTQVEQAITDFTNQLQSELNSQFAPVRSAFEGIVSQLVSAVDSFDPSSLTAEIENIINTVTGIFSDPNVQNALEQIKKLQDIADSIQEISFAPVADTVISGIDEIKGALESIDETTLDPPLPQMLGTAMSVLPNDIEPITDPLIDKLGDLIEAGPINLINQIKHIPQQVFDEVRKYDPQSLLGEPLAGPFDELMENAQKVSPQKFIDEIEKQFDALKDRLKETVRPGLALQPLVDLHQDLMVDLGKLNPGELIEPLDQKIQSVVKTLGESINLDQITDPIEDIVDQINRYRDLVKKSLDVGKHFVQKLDDLADASNQIDVWVDGIFDKIPDSIDTTALTTPYNNLAAAINSCKAAGLQGHVTTEFSPLDTVLTELNASQKLADMVAAVTGISRSAVEALPNSSTKTDLLNLLDSINITDDAVSGVLKGLGEMTTVSAEVHGKLTLKFGSWDDKYHRPGGTLDCFNQSSVDMAQLKTWLRDAIENQVTWVMQSILGKFTVMRGLLNQLITQIENLTDQVDTKVAALLMAPEAVLGLLNSVQSVIDNVSSINLDFLQNSINEIFDTTREKFNELNPAFLQKILDENFESLIDGIDFDLIIPPDSFDSLSASFDGLLVDLEALNPQTLLIDPLQEAFEENIQPFIDSLDVTPLLEAVIAKLEPLEDELKEEMGRVNTAYQEMLAAAPDTGLSVNVSVSF